MSDARRSFGSIFRLPGGGYKARYAVAHQRHSRNFRSRRAAEAFLARTQGELGLGLYVEPDVRRMTFEDLAELARQDYAVNGRRSAPRLALALRHLAESFAGVRVALLTTDRTTAHIMRRQQQGAAAGSIQKELSALKRAFRLALRAQRLRHVPYVPSLALRNARTGFFEEPEFRALVAALPAYLRPVMRFAFWTGWRVRSEVLRLTWAQVDFPAGVVRLEPGTTKTGAGRSFPFAEVPELCALLRDARAATDALQRHMGRVVPLVFHRAGRPIVNYYSAWRAAARRVGLVGMIAHDLRRTAVRNLVRAGVPEKTAMALTGHKTRAIFDRYDIVNEADLRTAVAKRVAAGRPAAERVVFPFAQAQER